MAASQLTATTVLARSLPSFEGLRPSTVKIVSFVPLKQGLSQRCFRFRPLVVKAATVVATKVAEPEDKTPGGVLLADTSKEKPLIGTVIAVGPGSLDQEGNRKPLSVSPGDTVVFFKLGGNEFHGKDGSDYIVLRAYDVLAVLSS
uniref:20 kDa chaperonin, chloroplastic n=1 Tax=Opuntia streptacantha TaxID=393608 RepID=A0A7C9FN54_OPUST